MRPPRRAVACLVFGACWIGCGADDPAPKSAPVPTVQLPVCDDLVPVLDDREWAVEEEATALRLWIGSKHYIVPGFGLARRVPPHQLERLGIQLGAPAIGKAGTLVLTTGGGPAILFDAGSGVTDAIYQSQVAALTSAMGVEQVRPVHLGHLHEDHFNQLESWIRAHGIPASELVVPWFMVPWNGRYRTMMSRLAADPAMAELGYGTTRLGSDIYESSRTRGYATASFGDARVVIEYTASEDAIEQLRERLLAGKRSGEWMDAAEALVTIRERGRPEKLALLGDLRGETLLDLSEKMGRANFERLFDGVDVTHGAQHHLGKVGNAKDVEGIVRLLRATVGRTGRLSVVVQTDDAQRRATLIRAFNHMAVDVTTVGSGTEAIPSNTVTSLTGAIARQGPAVERFPATSESLAQAARMAEIGELAATFRRHQKEIEEAFPAQASRLGRGLETADQELQRAFFGTENEIGGRAGLTVWKLLGGRRTGATVAINDAATFSESDLRRNAASAVLTRDLQQLLDESKAGERLRLLARGERLRAEIDLEVQDALKRGSSSPRLLELIELLEPGVRRGLLTRETIRHATLARHLGDALQRVRTYSGQETSVLAGSGRARFTTATLAVAEAARAVVEYWAGANEAAAVQKRDAALTFLWWMSRGAHPRVRATLSDGTVMTNPVTLYHHLTTPDYALSRAAIRRIGVRTDIPGPMLEQLEYLVLGTYGEREFLQRLRDRLGPAVAPYEAAILAEAARLPMDRISTLDVLPPTGPDLVTFMVWAEANISDLDQYWHHFQEAPALVVQHRGAAFPDGAWLTRTWRDGASVWIEDPDVARVMRQVGRRVVAATRARLAAAWDRRETVRQGGAGPAIKAVPDRGWDFGLDVMSTSDFVTRRPTGRATFEDGAPRIAYSVFDGAETLVPEAGWWTPAQEFFVYQNAGDFGEFVLVSGATFNTYGAIRAARPSQHHPEDDLALPPRRSRTEQSARIMEDIRSGAARYVRVGDDYEGIAQYWAMEPNRLGVALIRTADLNIVPATAAPVPAPSSAAAWKALPPPICNSFTSSAAGWRLERNDRTAPEDAGHRPGTAESNGYLFRDAPAGTSGIVALDLVLAFDLTGSMQRSIDQVRAAARDLVRQLAGISGDVRLGLVGYRDSVSNPGNVRQLYPLSSGVEERFREMDRWQAFGGGDEPEDELYALAGALAPEMGWEPTDSPRKPIRLIVAITDAPAKQSRVGGDFAGNTLESIGALAASQRTGIHSIVVGRSSLAIADGRTLAAATGGTVHESVDDVAASLLASTIAAVRGSPRYWVTPESYAGDRSGFYGSSLIASIWCQGTGPALPGDDVILTGAGKDLRIAAPRPPAGAQGTGGWVWDQWEFRLHPAAGWTSRGQPASEAAIRDVLRSLSDIRIRAEFHSGPSRCALDNVVLGADR